jgi:membrane protein
MRVLQTTSSSILARGGRALLPPVRYLMQTEVHVYAFSVSAGMLLSFFPFLIVMLSLCQHVLHWKAAVNAIYFTLDDYFPDAFGHFLRRNFEVTVASRGPVQIVSIVLLFFTASGIFESLEVALNRIWRCPTNRSYFKNQLIGLGLIFVCGALMLISTTLTALNNQFFKLAAVPLSMLLLFLIYWLLPNCKIKPARIIPAAIGVGMLLEILKYVNLVTWPYLRQKLAMEYGPFVYTVTIILWGFVASMVILAGAEFTARRAESPR